jgi:Leucine-rich repeat (LRR) protein
VQELKNLTRFVAQYNELLDVNVLTTCQKLEYLDVSYNTLLNVDVTASLSSLRELYFGHNEVTKLPKYKTGCALELISGEHNQLTSLGNLAGLEHLKFVYMDYNTGITSVNALVNCPVLEEVYVYGTKVKSVSALTEKGVYVVYSPA